MLTSCWWCHSGNLLLRPSITKSKERYSRQLYCTHILCWPLTSTFNLRRAMAITAEMYRRRSRGWLEASQRRESVPPRSQLGNASCQSLHYSHTCKMWRSQPYGSAGLKVKIEIKRRIRPIALPWPLTRSVVTTSRYSRILASITSTASIARCGLLLQRGLSVCWSRPWGMQ